jgi:purine-binding chemotaxis protein CheW
MIDKVSRVITVDLEEIQSPPEKLPGMRTEYIKGVTRKEEGFINILDIHKLFDQKELQQIESIVP